MVNQLLAQYQNDLFIDVDLLKYSVIKTIIQYIPNDVIESIFNKDSNFIDTLKLFVCELLEHNKGLTNKTFENGALKQLLLILKDYNDELKLDWNYLYPFNNLNEHLSNQKTKYERLYIDKDGSGKTLS